MVFSVLIWKYTNPFPFSTEKLSSKSHDIHRKYRVHVFIWEVIAQLWAQFCELLPKSGSLYLLHWTC